MTTQHTATPWDSKPSAGHEIHGQSIIWDANGKTIAIVYGAGPGDAALIVRAVNSHAALVEALEGVIRVADRKTDEFDAARAALALAKES